MKKLVLKSLKLKNFKGIKELFVPMNEVTTISGDNATGKTSINDAATYLLFGKDSQGRTDFDLQTLNEEGEVIHYLTHEVEAVFEFEGKSFTLRKVLEENWQKPRGQAESILKGTTTSYYIDDVPQKLKDYTAFINSLVDEKLFKLLTNPFAFEALNWKEKRAILFDMCGALTDEEVASGSNRLQELLNKLQGKSMEDFKKIVSEKKKKIKDDLSKIPARIDELNSSIEAIDVKAKQIELEIELTKLGHIEEQLEASAKAFEETRKKQQQIFKCESRLEMLKREALDLSMKEINEKKNLLNKSIYEQTDLIEKNKRYEQSINEFEKEKALNLEQLTVIQDKIAELRESWSKADAEVFNFDPSKGICPHCGQTLPLDKFNEAEEAARLCFEKAKQERLEAITSAGSLYKQSVSEYEEKNNKLNERIEKGKLEIKNNLLKLEEVEAQVNKLKEDIKGYETSEQQTIPDSDEMNQIKQDIDLLQEEVACATSLDNSELKAKKTSIQSSIDAIRGVITKADVHEKAKLRIKELEEEHTLLGQMLSELEQQEFLVEEFTRTKVNLLEDKINSQFKYVTFKLFNQQVNGGIAECCESLINGVPFSGANNAAKFNAGLDIINALVNYYGFSAPIFIDNAESVNELISTESQVIRLVVSHDKQLVIE